MDVALGVAPGVGLVTVGMTTAASVGVGDAPHEATALATRTSSKRAAHICVLPFRADPRVLG